MVTLGESHFHQRYGTGVPGLGQSHYRAHYPSGMEGLGYVTGLRLAQNEEKAVIPSELQGEAFVGSLLGMGGGFIAGGIYGGLGAADWHGALTGGLAGAGLAGVANGAVMAYAEAWLPAIGLIALGGTSFGYSLWRWNERRKKGRRK